MHISHTRRISYCNLQGLDAGKYSGLSNELYYLVSSDVIVMTSYGKWSIRFTCR